MCRFPWKSSTLPLDCPESKKWSEICAVSVVCSKVAGRSDILNFPFRPIVWFKESLESLFYFRFLTVKSLGLKNNQISFSFFPSPSLSLLNNESFFCCEIAALIECGYGKDSFQRKVIDSKKVYCSMCLSLIFFPFSYQQQCHIK